MSDMHLKVEPAALKSKGTEIETMVSNFKKDWEKIKQIITNSKNYWKGDTSDGHIKSFDKYKDEVDELVKRLGEHPVDLMKMAGVYEKAEKAAQTMANALDSNIIS